MSDSLVLILEPGDRLRRKDSNTLYLIRLVKDKAIVMLSEDGKSSLTILRGSPLLQGFEPVYD